jgi:hypothetical protein
MPEELTEILGAKPKNFVASALDEKYVATLCPFPENIAYPLESNSTSLTPGLAAEKLLQNNVTLKKILGCLLYTVSRNLEDFARAAIIAENPNTLLSLPENSPMRAQVALRTAIALTADLMSKNEEKRAATYRTYLLGPLCQVQSNINLYHLR